ncbi:MAG: T9SS type A sorting domain-containing protein [Bacteroidales bacterium]|nr:T9SS type A sorting domain-containing protein [Bacteroidales bacterium]
MSLALLIPILGFSQKYEGIQSLYVNTNEIPEFSGDRAGWFGWATSFSDMGYVMHWPYEIQGIFSRFEPADLTSRVGESITRIRYFWPGNYSPVIVGGPRARVYTGGSFVGDTYEGNMVVDFEASKPTASQGWKTITLPTPVLITGTEEVCFGVLMHWEEGHIFGTIDYDNPEQTAVYYHPLKSDLVILMDLGEDEEIFSLTDVGNEGYSWWMDAYSTLIAQCDPAKDLKVDYDEVNCDAVLTWTAPADNPGAKYNIYRDDVRIASSHATTTYLDPTLPTVGGFNPAEPHKWEVRAICSTGNETTGISVNKPLCKVCTPASNLKVEIKGNCDIAELTWDASSDATLYKIYKEDELVGTVAAPNTSFEMLGEYNKNITWKLITVCSVGEAGAITKITSCVGINENKFKFSIQPNPAHDKLTINATTPFNSVNIVNFLGQTVISQNNDTQTTTIDVSNLTQGVYFVRIVSDEGTSVQKFVKK